MNQDTLRMSASTRERSYYQIVRFFEGERTAEQVVADLMKVHMAGVG